MWYPYFYIKPEKVAYYLETFPDIRCFYRGTSDGGTFPEDGPHVGMFWKKIAEILKKPLFKAAGLQYNGAIILRGESLWIFNLSVLCLLRWWRQSGGRYADAVRGMWRFSRGFPMAGPEGFARRSRFPPGRSLWMPPATAVSARC
jgi:hypothetical protein